MSFIKRYMVYRDGKLMRYEDTQEEALAFIERNYNHKKEQEWSVFDMDNEEDIDVSDFLSSIHREAMRAKKPKVKKPKVGRNDIIDDEYSAWLGRQPCVITGKTAKRGAGMNDMHCHHIFGRARGRNDYLQVPLMGYVHSWGNKSYHHTAKQEFGEYWGLHGQDAIEYFLDKAEELRAEYLELTKV